MGNREGKYCITNPIKEKELRYEEEDHFLGRGGDSHNSPRYLLKYTSFGVTVVTVLVGLGGIVAGWIAKILYDRYVNE